MYRHAGFPCNVGVYRCEGGCAILPVGWGLRGARGESMAFQINLVSSSKRRAFEWPS